MGTDDTRRRREEAESAADTGGPTGHGKSGSGKPTRGATAEELKGVTAVPTEEDEDGHAGGALPRETPGDEVDPGAG